MFNVQNLDLFCRTFLQKRLILLGSLQSVAPPDFRYPHWLHPFWEESPTFLHKSPNFFSSVICRMRPLMVYDHVAKCVSPFPCAILLQMAGVWPDVCGSGALQVEWRGTLHSGVSWLFFVLLPSVLSNMESDTTTITEKKQRRVWFHRCGVIRHMYNKSSSN